MTCKPHREYYAEEYARAAELGIPFSAWVPTRTSNSPIMLCVWSPVKQGWVTFAYPAGFTGLH